MPEHVVQGYEFHSVDDHPRNRTICKILSRAPMTDSEAREMGPAFTVVFGDGSVGIAYASELSPWYPV